MAQRGLVPGYASFDAFEKAVNAGKLIKTASFTPQTEINLSRLAQLIKDGKCRSLLSLNLSGVKFTHVPPGKAPFSVLEETFKAIDKQTPRLLPKEFTLELENTLPKLTAEDARVLAELFSKFTTLSLNLRRNQLGNEGAHYLADALKKLPDKTIHQFSIYLENNQLRAAALADIAEAIFTCPDYSNNLWRKWKLSLGNITKEPQKEVDRANEYAELDIGEYTSAERIAIFTTNTPIITLSNCALGEAIRSFTLPGQKRDKKGEPEEEKKSDPTADAPRIHIEHPQPLSKVTAKPQPPLMVIHGTSSIGFRSGIKANIPEEERESIPIKLDDQKHRIYGYWEYENFSNPSASPSQGNANEAVYIGYTIQGLPYQVVVNGMDGNLSSDLRTKLFDFASGPVMKLISEHAYELSQAEEEDREGIINEFEGKVFAHKDCPTRQFGLSVALTYQKNDEIRCAGFGVRGTTGLAFKSGAAHQQLVHTVKTDAAPIDQAFDIPVAAGDEIFGYTSLKPQLLQEDGQKGLALKFDDLDASASLYSEIKKKNFARRYIDREIAKGNKAVYDSQYMLGSVKIPTAEFQRFLREYVKLAVMLQNLENELADNEYEEKLDQQKRKLLKDGREFQNKMFAMREDDEEVSVRELTFCLRRVNIAMQDPTFDQLKLLLMYADEVQGSPSPGMKVLGMIMISIGATLAVIGGLMMTVASVAELASLFGLTPVAAPTFVLGVAVASLGVGLMTAGAATFFGGRYRSGLSQSMVDVADTQREVNLLSRG